MAAIQALGRARLCSRPQGDKPTERKVWRRESSDDQQIPNPDRDRNQTYPRSRGRRLSRTQRAAVGKPSLSLFSTRAPPLRRLSRRQADQDRGGTRIEHRWQPTNVTPITYLQAGVSHPPQRYHFARTARVSGACTVGVDPSDTVRLQESQSDSNDRSSERTKDDQDAPIRRRGGPDARNLRASVP